MRKNPTSFTGSPEGRALRKRTKSENSATSIQHGMFRSWAQGRKQPDRRVSVRRPVRLAEGLECYETLTRTRKTGLVRPHVPRVYAASLCSTSETTGIRLERTTGIRPRIDVDFMLPLQMKHLNISAVLTWCLIQSMSAIPLKSIHQLRR